ncbi:hypothetical protein DH2020_017591 [Rehmannia glutinosa]|uniref:Uncharacterized protein n=1 Tax=Rehmannia glutinosa TaxID=99300 RepID=A0ABR0WRY0_REHGL
MAVERHPLVVSGVVGDVLEPFTATTELRVYSDGRTIFNGSSMRPSQVAGRPRVEIGGEDFRTFYTLETWLVTDIPGSTGAGFGNELVSYESPRPLMGIHRLVLALFQQAARQTVNPPGRRHNFNTREFSQLYDLGSPVAAVYYNCHRENGTGGRRA